MKNNSTLHLIGSCSGTEPFPGRHHTAFALDFSDRLYWFDAGECCSYNAYLAGIDLPSTESVFISHTHMDHIGGLPNLLWTLRKLTSVSEEARSKLENRQIDVFIPDITVFEGMLAMLRGTEGGFKTVFDVIPQQVNDGLIYDRHGLRVTAQHNFHLGVSEPWLSYSFRIEAGEKVIVYSGDVKSIEDFENLIDGADLLLMETGHHKAENVCRYLQTAGKDFDRLVFLHHGRAILKDPEGELRKARDIIGDKVAIADDGMVIEL